MSRVWCVVVSALAWMMQWQGGSSSYASSASAIIDPSKVKQISWKPRSVCVSAHVLLIKLNLVASEWWLHRFGWCRAFVYEGFLTELECDHLISIAKSELKRSVVADNLSGESKLSEIRTSSGMFISKNKVLYLHSLLLIAFIEFWYLW